MRRRKHQAGFSMVGAVLVVAAIAVLGVAGWFVYQHNRLKLTGAASSSHYQVTPPAPTKAAAATTIVKIPELGIQISVPNNLKDLTYQASTVTLSNGNKATYALLSTKSLAASDAKCGGSAAPLGSLETASGQYPSSDPYAALDYGPLLKQFPTFYVTYSSPQGGCSDSTSVRAVQSNDKAALQAALSSVQALN